MDDRLATGLALPLAPLVEAIAAEIARLVAEREEADRSPWLTKAEAIEYTRIKAGTFAQMAADGRIPSHGGKVKVFHRPELDEALKRL